jgi:hypothetical protein
MSEQSTELPSQWCLVGNIVEERPYGEGGTETKRGTKHFSPGTKVYCLPSHWGDGYEKIRVIGRHRGSRQFATLVIRADWVTNWRAKVVYDPVVLRLIHEATEKAWIGNWSSKEHVETYVSLLKERDVEKGAVGREVDNA